MHNAPAVSIGSLSHRYGEQLALDSVSFDVPAGRIFGLLGPNGGGKTTLFRILATLLPVQSGMVRVQSLDVAAQPAAVRSRIGVTFQSPSLDRKLTVIENLRIQGQLYGLRGVDLGRRMEALLMQLGLADRAGDRVESLSGGLARRVEIAKGLLHAPGVLLLDEPSTGLDPGARLDLWRSLTQLRDEAHVTVLVTTHLMEEAHRCDELAILDRGKVVALGTPFELQHSIGGDCLSITAGEPDSLARDIAAQFNLPVKVVDGRIRIETERGHEFVGRLVETFGLRITSVSLGRANLEDVFVQRTGHRFWNEPEPAR